MKKTVIILSILILFSEVLFLAGCFTRNQNPMAVQSKNTQAEMPIQVPVPEVRFEFVSHNSPNKTKAPDAAILAAGEVTPQVTFKLILINVGNTSNPTTTLSKTVSVVNGAASCSFSSIPVQTVIGDIHIEGGHRSGFQDFHGMLDLQPDTINTVLLDGKGSKSKIDFAANVIETLVGLTGRSDLLSKVVTGLAARINTAITNIDTTTQTYDDALNLFLNYVPAVSPIESIDESKIAVDPRDNSRLMKDEVVVTFRISPTIQDIAAEANKLGGSVIASFPDTNTYVYRINSNDTNTILTTVQTMQAQAQEQTLDIEYGSNGIVEGFGLPNDPDYSRNWGLSKVKAAEIWDLLPQTNVEVAVLDTGIKADHEDLHDAIDFENSRNFTGDYSGDPRRIDDGNGHGTHVAGIIAARSNNNRGTVGVAPNLKLVVVKCLDNNNMGKETNVAAAIDYAAGLPNVRVINLSLGKSVISGMNKSIPAAIEKAFRNGKMVVAAAGNGNMDGGTVSPGNWARCVTVSATDENDTRASYSNFGAIIDISAPGGTKSNGIYSTWNSNGSSYEYNSGTSMAAPFVSGLAGVIFSIKPDLTPNRVEEIIKKTADQAFTEPFYEIGTGRINMVKALAEVGTVQQNQAPTIAITGPTTLDAGATGEFRAKAQDGDDSSVTFAWSSTSSNKPQVVSNNALESVASWKAPDTGGRYYISCKATDPKGASKDEIYEVYVKSKPIAINFISPTSGKTGTEVAISGLNFGATQGTSVVKVNGVAVAGSDIVSWSDTQVKIKIPANATSGLVVLTVNGVDTSGVQLDIDNLAPEVSAVLANGITENGVTITWTTNEFSSSQVEYGFDSSYGTLSALDTAMTKSHSVSLSGLGSNKTYHFKVRSKDAVGNESASGDNNFVTQNVAPTVSITSPGNNAAFSTDNSITIIAAASDPDGEIAKVEFYQGNTLLGQSTSSPYRYTWDNVQAGNYVLTAKAYDKNGATKTSTAISIVVNLPSTVNLTAPSNNAVITLGDGITITVAATAPGGSVTKVEFYDGNTMLGQSTISPYSYTWTNPSAGNHVLTAKAYDSLGAVKTSPSVNVTVNTLPSVSITAPANNAVIVYKESVSITANASDLDGTINKVEFFIDSTKIGEDGSAPYSCFWTASPTGYFSLSAKAFDNLGGSKISSSISIVVNPPKPISIAKGHWFNLVKKDDGTIWSWGRNDSGQLGDGTLTERHIPGLVSTTEDITTISCGGWHVLALKADGTVLSWGNNYFGTLGDGTNTNRTTPGPVSNLTGVIAISAGYNHSVALKNDGSVWTWGYNGNGRLGDSSTIDRNLPYQVYGNAVGIVAAARHTLALLNDGTIKAWGRNDFGQIGDGTTMERLSPTLVSNFSGGSMVSGGDYFSSGLKSDGTVWSWGWNAFGNLGNGSMVDSSIPVQAVNLSGISSISAGGIFVLALKNDGTIKAWGHNSFGQLGDGTTINRSSPVSVSNLSGIIAVGAGQEHSIALKSDGTVWTWGRNDYGQLGDGTTLDRSTPVQVQW
ncbi:S8 family serine peptidase [bacterium]|nr:S8 family serine peptidase [bacterium]